ncbi:hypothetical protein BDA99DRAFT_508338 [Phascolomyces articulosus]|uniref:Uncharacterized protein n=1 Tax=Phascolomyces articulosus TaxID=60185 RepID=A0AAD5K0Q1_9FUNG|nr:hypothetical protein BDA99DRAFT_508338 [Phascolomyces articulosus]
MKLLQVPNEKVNNSTAFHLFSSYMKLHAVFEGTFEIVPQSFNAPLLTLNGLNCFFSLIYLINLLYSLKLFLQYFFFCLPFHIFILLMHSFLYYIFYF